MTDAGADASDDVVASLLAHMRLYSCPPCGGGSRDTRDIQLSARIWRADHLLWDPDIYGMDALFCNLAPATICGRTTCCFFFFYLGNGCKTNAYLLWEKWPQEGRGCEHRRS
jgi:hypothetical protein